MFLEKSGLLIELVWGCSVGSKNVSNLVTCGQTALILWLFDRTAKPKEMSVEGDLKREIQFSFFTKTQCHLASFPVILYYLSPIDKAVFNAQVRRYWLVRVCFPFVCMQRWQLCYQRLFGRVFLWILVVWFMFTDRICVVTPSYGGWDGVMLVQYCVRPEVEII